MDPVGKDLFRQNTSAGSPAVSIVVPVHNAEPYIRKTIESVRQQTYTDWELLLIDDCSTDESNKIIREEITGDPRMRLITDGIQKGAAATRNIGIDAAAGRYIAFLDADDIWLPDKLAHELAFADKTGAAFVFTSYVFGDEKGQPLRKIVHAPASLDFAHALSRTVIFTSTVLLDRQALGKELIRMPEIESEDTACWWSILKSGVTAMGLDEVLTIYRRPGGSLSSNKLRSVKRIWGLYRQIAGLSVPSSLYHLIGWAPRATLRRL